MSLLSHLHLHQSKGAKGFCFVLFCSLQQMFCSLILKHGSGDVTTSNEINATIVEQVDLWLYVYPLKILLLLRGHLGSITHTYSI